MRYPRCLNRWYANLVGYFWLECARCNKMFGGHELGGTDWYIETDQTQTGNVCCYRCPTDETYFASEHKWRPGHWLYSDGHLCEIFPIR